MSAFAWRGSALIVCSSASSARLGSFASSRASARWNQMSGSSTSRAAFSRRRAATSGWPSSTSTRARSIHAVVVPGVERGRRLEGAPRERAVAEREPDLAQVPVRERVPGTELDRALVGLGGLLPALRVVEGGREVELGLEAPRVHDDGRLEAVGRLGVAAGFVEADALGDERVHFLVGLARLGRGGGRRRRARRGEGDDRRGESSEAHARGV